MRDTRKTRAILVLALSAALGAVIGEAYLKPTLDKVLR